MINIGIIILNRNRKDDTLECLDSVKKLLIGNFRLQIFVVDNASTDDSVTQIKKLIVKNQNNKLKFKIIQNKENLGFAGGNNVGIKYALSQGADYIVILNNDTVVSPNLITQIVKVAENTPGFGLASPKIYFARGFEFHKARYQKQELGKVIWYAGGEIDWDNVYGKCHGVDEVDTGQYDKIVETDFATGTCMVIKSKILAKTGLFDEKYFLYYEDTDLSVRMKKRGYKVLYIPETVVWHKVAQSSGIGSCLNDYYTARNRLVFGLKYAPVRAKVALVKESIKLLKTGRKWQKIGIRDFYLGRLGKGSWKQS